MENELSVYDFYKSRKKLHEIAKEGLKENKGKSLSISLFLILSQLAFIGGVLLIVFSFLPSSKLSNSPVIWIIIGSILILVAMFTYGPLKISLCKISKNMVENSNPSFSDIKYGFKVHYGRNVFYGIRTFFVYLFGFILLVFPFILVFPRYQISGYILVENEDYTIKEATHLAKNYTKGNVGRYIALFFSFAKYWIFLVITAFIYDLWLRPKYYSVMYCYYKDIAEF